MKADLVIRNGQVFVNGEFFQGGIAVKDGKTAVICEDRFLPEGEEVIDAKGNPVLPGVVDTHVHVRDPGHRERGDIRNRDQGCGGGWRNLFSGTPYFIAAPLLA